MTTSEVNSVCAALLGEEIPEHIYVVMGKDDSIWARQDSEGNRWVAAFVSEHDAERGMLHQRKDLMEPVPWEKQELLECCKRNGLDGITLYDGFDLCVLQREWAV